MAKKRSRLVESWTYVPILDRDPKIPVGERTTFRLTPLTQPERMAVRDELAYTRNESNGSQTVHSQERQVARRLCLTHIEAVENFPAGTPEPWPKDEAERARYLEGMDDELVREIGDEIFTRSNIGELEKNS